MDEETIQAAHAFCTLFDYNYRNLRGSNSASIAVSLFTVFILTLYEKTKHMVPVSDSDQITMVSRNLLSRFMAQLRQDYKLSHRVSYYAGKVYVSPKYLTQVVRKSLGMTPKELIDRKLAIESMYMLGESKMSIQEIALDLGFPDQSYFGRFFKRMLGLSPLSFRKNPDMRLMTRLKPIRQTELFDVLSKP